MFRFARTPALTLAFLVLLAGIATGQSSVEKEVETRYDSELALYAASDFVQSGIPFFRSFFPKGWPSNERIREVTILESEGFARQNIRALCYGSRSGLTLSSSRRITRLASEETQSAEAFLGDRLQTFSRLAGNSEFSTDGLDPVYLPFEEGTPLYTSAYVEGEWANQAWKPSDKEKVLSPGSIGFLMATIIRLARYDLERNHEAKLGSREVELLGVDGPRGRDAMILLDIAAAQVQALPDLVSNGRKIEPFDFKGYDPYRATRYFPNRIRVKTVGGEPSFDPIDPKSHLRDQAGLVLGLSELFGFMDPTREDSSFQEVSGRVKFAGVQAEPFEASIQAEALQALKFLFQNLTKMHFDARAKPLSFISFSDPKKGKGAMTEILTTDMGLISLAMASVMENVEGPAGSDLVGKAEKYLEYQANFLVKVQGEDGSFFDGYDSRSLKPTKKTKSLKAQGLAIQALLAADRLVPDAKADYKGAAMRALHHLDESRYLPRVGIYSATESGKNGQVDPMDWAAVQGALRDATRAFDNIRILHRFVAIFHGYKSLRLQLSESEATGGEDDGDGVPSPDNGGGRHGAAPVFVARVTYKLTE